LTTHFARPELISDLAVLERSCNQPGCGSNALRASRRATLAGSLFYVVAGGILMLAAWLAAAGLAFALPARSAAQAVRVTP
jgi:hypothetical protein